MPQVSGISLVGMKARHPTWLGFAWLWASLAYDSLDSPSQEHGGQPPFPHLISPPHLAHLALMLGSWLAVSPEVAMDRSVRLAQGYSYE